MKNEAHKYIVTYTTTAWDSIIEAPIEKESKSAEIFFNGSDILENRKQALEKAESLIDLFQNDPAIKYEAITPFEPQKTDSKIVMLYEVKVEFQTENETLCIFTVGETGCETEEVLNNLKKEYDILKNMGHNLNDLEKVVEVYDAQTKIKSEVIILENGMDWTGMEINVIASFKF